MQLQAELATADIQVPGLGSYPDGDGIELHTYDETGASIDLPPEAAAVVSAHVPPPPPPVPDYGADDTKVDKIAEGVTQLRAYLALPSPTAAQTVGALKLTIRGLLFLMRRTGL